MNLINLPVRFINFNKRNQKNLLVFTFPLFGMFCLSMFRISIGVLIPEVSLEFSLNEVEVSFILSAYLTAMALVMALSGFASDKLGKKLIMSLGLFTVTLGIFMVYFSYSFGLLIASTFIAGIGAGFYTPALYAYAGELLPVSKGFLAGLSNSVYAFGGFFGPLIFSLITKAYNWRTAILFFAFLSLISFASIWIIPYNKIKVKQRKIPYTLLLKNKNIILITFALTIVNAGFVAFTAWTPKFLIEIEKFNIVYAGLLFGLYSFFGGFGTIIFGFLSDKFNRCKIISFVSATAAILTIFYYLISIYDNFLLRAIFSSILGLFSHAYWGLSTAAAQDFTESSFFGSITGFVQNIAVISAALSPPISGSLINCLGLRYALIISIALPYFIHSIIFMVLSLKTKVKM
ncbi:MAG: MFS transporter [Candidatus Bathyarchaeia archaeon]|nr:MFS transporter [Candidatus Bathyarchaeota archaeon]